MTKANRHLDVTRRSRGLDGGACDACRRLDAGQRQSEVERAGLVLRPVETPEGECVAIDALVRARRLAEPVV